MNRFVFAVIIGSLLSSAVYAADIPFYASWEEVTKRVDGKPVVVSEYVVYACNGLIYKMRIYDPVTCNGNMQTFTTIGTSLSGTYLGAPDRGYLFFKVTAKDTDGRESLLSRMRVCYTTPWTSTRCQ